MRVFVHVVHGCVLVGGSVVTCVLHICVDMNAFVGMLTGACVHLSVLSFSFPRIRQLKEIPQTMMYFVCLIQNRFFFFFFFYHFLCRRHRRHTCRMHLLVTIPLSSLPSAHKVPLTLATENSVKHLDSISAIVRRLTIPDVVTSTK